MEGVAFYLLISQIYVYQFKSKDSEIKPYSLYLGNILKDFLVHNMKKAELNGCLHNFSVDHKTSEHL